jgi:hypothetical protein
MMTRPQVQMILLWLFSKLVGRCLKQTSSSKIFVLAEYMFFTCPVIKKEKEKKSTFVKNFNATLISLILKKPRAVDIKEFRPISLVGAVCKILANVLANRLKMVVEKIILSLIMLSSRVGQSLTQFSLPMSALTVGLDLRL